MNSAPNPTLREYVTRVGFSLQLTRPQMLFLLLLAEQNTTRRFSGLSHFLTSGGALRRKGLIFYGDEDREALGGDVYNGPKLTRAGEAVVTLLKEAGVWAEMHEMELERAS